jgi:phosphinothricin acetyltransferase
MPTIRKFREDDWEAVCRIYRQGMETNLATFESEIPPYSRWNAGHLPFGRLVAEQGGSVIGWVALSPSSSRRCFAGVAEVSIYVADGAKHCGAGMTLLNGVIEVSEQNGIWTLQSSIMRNNEPSLSLHKKCGFRVVGIREKIARDPLGQWRDTVLMERRSSFV